MTPHIDHVSVAVRDLNEATERFARIGFEVTPGGTLASAGTRNALIRLGTQYVELITVDSALLAAREELAGPPLVDMVQKHEGGLVGFSVTSEHLEHIAHKEEGIRGVTGLGMDGPFTMRRQVPGGGEVVWRVILPSGVVWRRPWPALVEWDTPEVERLRLEPAPDHANGVTGIAGVAIVVANLDTAITVYRDALGFDAPVLDTVPALAASRATFAAGDASIQLLSSQGAGQLGDYLAEWGEGPFALTLSTRDVEHARQALEQAGLAASAEATQPDQVVVPPDAVYGMRLIIERARDASAHRLPGPEEHPAPLA